MRFGVCYYPEQWDRSKWPDDARRMADLGLQIVRIGEFAWSMIEPSPDEFAWGWLDEAIGVLGDAGLSVMLGTPTAAPPKWLVDAHPDILPWDKFGRPRQFGSRRHYCFSSPTYRDHTRRIVTAVAQRYGGDSTVTAWQTDNEYGCHDTVRSYSPAAQNAFRTWLLERYCDVEVLNAAWGTRFWSQCYRNFDQIDLPNLTVTAPNPSHMLDFFRFSSDQVVSFNRLQVDILREHSPDRDIYHNFMGFFTDFDHFAVGADIDVAGWDSYPLGHLDQEAYCPADKARYRRQGHPNYAAFHHDLYRACGRGRFAVLEQQPGPVNWSAHNPAPLDGMVQLWTHEAAAHGAELVSYFRWRQAPFAQEQMHAGLLRADDQAAPGLHEVRKVIKEVRNLPPTHLEKAEIAFVFSYESQWMWEALPHASHWDYLIFVQEWYGALRRFGHNVDVVPPGQDLSEYKLVVVPSLLHVNEEALAAFENTCAVILFGPRCGSKTKNLHVPNALPPEPLKQFLPLTVTRSETFARDYRIEGSYETNRVCAHSWLDHVETDLKPLAETDEKHGLIYRNGRFWFLTCVPNHDFLAQIFANLMRAVGYDIHSLSSDCELQKAVKQT